MIRSFRDKDTERLFNGEYAKKMGFCFSKESCHKKCFLLILLKLLMICGCRPVIILKNLSVIELGNIQYVSISSGGFVLCGKTATLPRLS